MADIIFRNSTNYLKFKELIDKEIAILVIIEMEGDALPEKMRGNVFNPVYDKKEKHIWDVKSNDI